MLFSPLLLALNLTGPLAANSAQDAPRPGDAIAAIESGEYDRARTILTALLAEEGMATARERIAAEQPLDALAPLDEVLGMDPRNGRAWALRGQAALAAADQGHQQAFLYGDALQSFERALRFDDAPTTFLGASRAALATAEFEKSLGYARKGLEALDALESSDWPELDPPAERTLSEASYRVFIDKKQAGEDASSWFAETEASLLDLIGRTPEDSWPWIRLAELYQWEELQRKAADTLALGLGVAPDDVELHTRLGNSLRGLDGRQGVIDFYTDFNSKHADNALSIYFEAGETVYQAIDELLAGRDSTSRFEAAEALYRRSRELEQSYTDSCIGYEIICRNGVGWCRFNNEDYQGAEKAFLSMEELRQGGLEYQLEGQLFSGVRGLEFVADRYSRDNRNPESLARAAAVFDYLRGYRPEDSNFANNSGFFHRDAAVAMEVQSMLSLRDADQSEDAARAEELRAQSKRWRERAQELMARSYAAYQAASELIPADVRVVNDTGLIQTYYVRQDAEAAERYLTQAIAAAEEQIPALEAQVAAARAVVLEERAAAEAQAAAAPEETAEGADGEAGTEAAAAPAPEEAAPSAAEQALQDLEDQLDQLREAYGDAFENRGILYLTMTDEPERARAALERCVEIGPRPRVPRQWVEQVVLPICDEVAAGDEGAIQRLSGRVWLHVGPTAGGQ